MCVHVYIYSIITTVVVIIIISSSSSSTNITPPPRSFLTYGDDAVDEVQGMEDRRCFIGDETQMYTYPPIIIYSI